MNHPTIPPRVIRPDEVFEFRHSWGPRFRGVYLSEKKIALALYVYDANARLPPCHSLYEAFLVRECPIGYHDFNLLPTWILQRETNAAAVDRFEAATKGLPTA